MSCIFAKKIFYSTLFLPFFANPRAFYNLKISCSSILFFAFLAHLWSLYKSKFYADMLSFCHFCTPVSLWSRQMPSWGGCSAVSTKSTRTWSRTLKGQCTEKITTCVHVLCLYYYRSLYTWQTSGCSMSWKEQSPGVRWEAIGCFRLRPIMTKKDETLTNGIASW